MKFTDIFIRRPILALSISLLIVLLGGVVTGWCGRRAWRLQAEAQPGLAQGWRARYLDELRRGQPEATALLSRSRSEEASQQLMLVQALEGAYREYEIARTQVNALENGILREAESTMKVAEAAYRFGERGILEYLDAQRVFRAARNELIAARYALQLAAIEIERLRAPQ